METSADILDALKMLRAELSAEIREQTLSHQQYMQQCTARLNAHFDDLRSRLQGLSGHSGKTNQPPHPSFLEFSPSIPQPPSPSRPSPPPLPAPKTLPLTVSSDLSNPTNTTAAPTATVISSMHQIPKPSISLHPSSLIPMGSPLPFSQTLDPSDPLPSIPPYPSPTLDPPSTPHSPSTILPPSLPPPERSTHSSLPTPIASSIHQYTLNLPTPSLKPPIIGSTTTVLTTTTFHSPDLISISHPLPAPPYLQTYRPPDQPSPDPPPDNRDRDLAELRILGESVSVWKSGDTKGTRILGESVSVWKSGDTKGTSKERTSSRHERQHRQRRRKGQLAHNSGGGDVEKPETGVISSRTGTRSQPSRALIETIHAIIFGSIRELRIGSQENAGYCHVEWGMMVFYPSPPADLLNGPQLISNNANVFYPVGSIESTVFPEWRFILAEKIDPDPDPIVNRKDWSNAASAASAEKQEPTSLVLRSYVTMDRYEEDRGVVKCGCDVLILGKEPHPFPIGVEAVKNRRHCVMMAERKKEATNGFFEGIEMQGIETVVVTSNKQQSGWMRMKKIGDAREVFDEMPHEKFVSFSTINCGLTSHCVYWESLMLFLVLQRSGEVMKYRFESKDLVGIALLEAHVKCENVTDSHTVFAKRNISLVSCHRLTFAIGLNDLFEESLLLFKQMRAISVVSNTISLLKFSHNCIGYGSLERCKRGLPHMMKARLSSQDPVMNVVLEMCWRHGNGEIGIKFDYVKDLIIVTDQLEGAILVIYGVAVMLVRESPDFELDPSISNEVVDDYLEEVQQNILDRSEPKVQEDEILPTVYVQKLYHGKTCEDDLAKAVIPLYKAEIALLTAKPPYAFGEKGQAAAARGGVDDVLPNAKLHMVLELISWKTITEVGNAKKLLKKVLKEREDYECPNEGVVNRVTVVGKLEEGRLFVQKEHADETLLQLVNFKIRELFQFYELLVTNILNISYSAWNPLVAHPAKLNIKRGVDPWVYKIYEFIDDGRLWLKMRAGIQEKGLQHSGQLRDPTSLDSRATTNMNSIECAAFLEADREIEEVVSTWKPLESLYKQQFNHHLEDKVVLKGEGMIRLSCRVGPSSSTQDVKGILTPRCC